MIQYPLHFPVKSKAKPGIQTTWHTETPFYSLETAIPVEFEGVGGGFSPEDYFAMALINCYIATFKVVAEKSKLVYASIHAEGKITVSRNEQGAPHISTFHYQVELNGASDPERAKRLMEKTSQMCLIHQSVKTVITSDFIVSM